MYICSHYRQYAALKTQKRTLNLWTTGLTVSGVIIYVNTNLSTYIDYHVKTIEVNPPFCNNYPSA